MAIEVGAKVTGKVSGITNFGAFVDLSDNRTGLVHISQISNHYIKDINDVLSVGDEVTVKVTKIGDDGKIALSMKDVNDDQEEHHGGYRQHGHGDHHEYHHEQSSSNNGFHNHHRANNARPLFGGRHENSHFDDMLASYMKESDARLSTLKRQTDGKRGGRGGRRS